MMFMSLALLLHSLSLMASSLADLEYSRGGVTGSFRTRPIFTSSNTRPSFTVESSLVPSLFPGGGGGT